MGFYKNLIKEAKDKGVYHDHANPEFAMAMVAMLEGALLVAKGTGEQRYLEMVCVEVRNKLQSWLH